MADNGEVIEFDEEHIELRFRVKTLADFPSSSHVSAEFLRFRDNQTHHAGTFFEGRTCRNFRHLHRFQVWHSPWESTFPEANLRGDHSLSAVTSPLVAFLSTSTDTHSTIVSSTQVAEIYDEHAEFVWTSLHRLGVREFDLPDQTQEVFIVVHRRIKSWDKDCLITTWLFGICRRVASGYRRKAWIRRERPSDELEKLSDDQSPEQAVTLREARERLEAALRPMKPDRRALFVMYELEERSCAEIALLFDVPLGTVHSRLSNAREEFRRNLARIDRGSK